MLDPADCGPAFLGLPQDVQGWAYDYPVELFAKKVHRIRRQAPDAAEIADAAALLKSAERPMIIAGGGVQYSGAVAELTAFAEAHAIPVVETIAGRANLLATHPLNIGPVGVTGSDSANAIAEKADVILAVGTRLQDFTTGSWTAFDKDARSSSGSTPRAMTRQAPVAAGGGRCETGLKRWGRRWRLHGAGRLDRLRAGRAQGKWDAYVADNVAHGNRPNSYAQAIGVVNALCDPRDRVVTRRAGCRPKSPPTGARSISARSTSSSAFPAWATRSPAAGARASPSPSANRTRTPSSSSATAPTC
jgi:3D-(3,5/4)-trihydroxycyclohexane-1,2-dione acylhydrolase (decyclizing)